MKKKADNNRKMGKRQDEAHHQINKQTTLSKWPMNI